MVVELKLISQRHIRLILRGAVRWCIERKVLGTALDPDLMLYRILRPEGTIFANDGFCEARVLQIFAVLALESHDEPSCQFPES